MNVREKLVELLEPHVSGLACEYESGSCELTSCRSCNARNIADHLIANGVTVQEWISVKDRLPKPNVPVLVTRDYGWGCVVDRDVLSKNGEWCYLERNCEVTHWMPMPEPPKGE